MAVGLRIALFCMFFAFFATVSSAADTAPAPAPAEDCSTVILNMANCLSFVSEGSTAKKPEDTCCKGLKTVLKTNAECLCEAFKNSAQLGVKLNVTKAMTLPAACHVSAPSFSNCALSPLAASPSSVSGAPTTSIGTNEIAPAPAPGSSGSSPLVTSVGMFVLTSTVATASFALF